MIHVKSLLEAMFLSDFVLLMENIQDFTLIKINKTLNTGIYLFYVFFENFKKALPLILKSKSQTNSKPKNEVKHIEFQNMFIAPTAKQQNQKNFCRCFKEPPFDRRING